MIFQLALDVLAQAHQAAPRYHLTPFLLSALVLTLLGATAAGRTSRGPVAALLGAAAGLSLAVAVTLTLFRIGPWAVDLTGLRRCAVTAPEPLSPDGAVNLLLFAPTAFLAVLAVGRPVRVVAGLAALSVLIETVQAATSVGVCDSSDVLLNTAGATGAALVALAARAAVGRARTAGMPGSAPWPRSS